MRISSIRFLVFVFKQESKAVRSIWPCSIRCRMMFLPEAPKISEMKEDRRKPELCKNFSILFFWDVISRMMLLRYRFKSRNSRILFSGIKLPFRSPARSRVEIHSESRMSVFLPGTFFIWRAFTTNKVISPENASSSIS